MKTKVFHGICGLKYQRRLTSSGYAVNEKARVI